jgi:hypothetical protein
MKKQHLTALTSHLIFIHVNIYVCHSSWKAYFFKKHEHMRSMHQNASAEGRGPATQIHNLIPSQQHNTIQYNTIQYNTTQYNTIQYTELQTNLNYLLICSLFYDAFQ